MILNLHTNFNLHTKKTNKLYTKKNSVINKTLKYRMRKCKIFKKNIYLYSQSFGKC